MIKSIWTSASASASAAASVLNTSGYRHTQLLFLVLMCLVHERAFIYISHVDNKGCMLSCQTADTSFSLSDVALNKDESAVALGNRALRSFIFTQRLYLM